MTAQRIREELAWLMYAWERPAGEPLPDALPPEEFLAWEVKARGILSRVADELHATGHERAARHLANDPTYTPVRDWHVTADRLATALRVAVGMIDNDPHGELPFLHGVLDGYDESSEVP